MSGGIDYWKRYAADKELGAPVRVISTPTGYLIRWQRHSKSTPFVGSTEKKKKLVRELTEWANANEQ